MRFGCFFHRCGFHLPDVVFSRHPFLGGRVFFSSPKEAAKALIDTEWQCGGDAFMERITIEGTRVVVLSLFIPKDDKWLSPELSPTYARAIASIEHLLTSNGVQLVEDKAA